MLSSPTIVLVALAYLGFLFAVAHVGDRRAEAGRSLVANPWVYALSLAVYCSAWTFYGSVGRAATSGVGFLPIYLGPTLAACLFWVLLRKVVRIAKVERITSIADFLASRYGKSRAVAVAVTLLAVFGIVPYIALQLKAVATSYLVLARGAGSLTDPAATAAPDVAPTALVVAAVLAAFAVLFGTRHLDVTERHEGLVLAVAVESGVKLLAFLAVGAWVTFSVHDGPGELLARALADPDLRDLATFRDDPVTWTWMVVLAAGAIVWLPRQFQVAVVENVDEDHLRRAAWLFPLYLLAINVFVLPVAFAGRLALPADVDADTFVLALPLVEGETTLALLAFVGGLSAATGMVIVETVALSTMVSNDLVLPLLLRSRTGDGTGLLRVRRLAIVAILALGYGYLVSTDASGSLVSIGLVSFAAVAQLGPAFVGALYWRGGTARGALAGLIGGSLVWGYTLPLPTLVGHGWLSPAFVETGPWGIGWLRPYALFGLEGLDPLAHSMFWSLLVNVGAYALVSSTGVPSPRERAQARRFVDVFRRSPSDVEPALWTADTPIAAVRALLHRFLGSERTDRALAAHAEARGLDWTETAHADAELLAFAERLLAGTTGAASARIALESVVRERTPGVDEVVGLLDESARERATRRQLEEKSRQLEAATEELRALDRLKDEFLATMAHELRTPLTSIRAFTEILHDRPHLAAGRRREFLGVVMEENERLSRLIDDVLDLSKLEAGAVDLHRKPVPTTELLRRAARGVDGVAVERSVVLEIRCEGPETLEVDPGRFDQVLSNLLANALKFCPEGGWIEIASSVDAEGTAEIAVSDDGPGVEEASREAVFERFYQSARPDGDRPRGTGLGLAICRRLVEAHGGTIRVETSERGGARFVVALPSDPAAEAAEDRIDE